MSSTTIVINGDAIRYAEGLTPGDYGVVLAQSLHVVGNNISGAILDCNGNRTPFYMPLSVFRNLEYLETPQAA